MKTSAGIYCKNSNKSQETSNKFTTKGSLLATRYSLLFVVAALLSSCATVQHGTVAEGPSPASQPAEKPAEKEKPSSAFQEFKGDKRQVVASWYGPEFHGKPTSSGEPFNMYALTCAHREYPFGTRLKVMNMQNRKEVECTVNDRGPFIPGRDLDLSYAAARKIDLIGPGTSTVTIEPVGRDQRYVKYVRYSALSGTMTIQVGSFREEANAKRLKTALELRYKNVYILEADIGGTKYYRVRVGKFTGKGDAAGIGSSLAEEGYSVIITKFEQRI